MMPAKTLRLSERLKGRTILGIAIFAFTLFVFMISRVHQVTDSSYSMMLSQSLLDHGSFALDHYALPPAYQLETVNGHTYYRFPPGTPVLSAPFVWVLNRLGVSAVNEDGTYNPRGEVMIEAGLAALLMAGLAVIFFFTSSLILPPGWSAVVALGGALGTQVYSTASRALWSDTWGILLLGVVIFLLLAHETGKRRISPVLLASLLSWMYFIRPTFAVPILAISVYIFLFHRTLFLRYAITGAVWLVGFVAYSWFHYGQVLPNYYRADRLLFNVFWTALAGNLISPARGLLVYVPALIFVGYLLVRFRKFLSHKTLVWLSLTIIVLHLIAVSGFPHWWGGHSFGPRFTTGLVPWLVLLAILGIRAMLRWREQRSSTPSLAWRVQLVCGSALLLLSVFINTLGATSHEGRLYRRVLLDHQPALHQQLQSGLPLQQRRAEPDHAESEVRTRPTRASGSTPSTAQDQWTRGKLTLQGAVRYDHAWSYYPAQQLGPTRFLPTPLVFPETQGVLGYNDIDPRFGVAYDLFGNGKTALKFNAGRYLEAAVGGNGNYSSLLPVVAHHDQRDPDVDRCQRELHARLRSATTARPRICGRAAAISAAR